MKKIIALVLSMAVIFAVLAGCTSNTKKEGPSSSNNSSKVVAEGDLKTGLAVISSVNKSKDAGESDGLAQVDSVVVAVTVGSDGKIVSCFIDSVQTKVDFTAAGQVKTDLATKVKTKMELGDEYGMGKTAKKGEWNVQAVALANYVEGKTVEEVKGIAVSDSGAPTGADLSASVTMSIGGYIDAIEKPASNAKALGAKSGDKLGLGAVTNIKNSKDAGEADGQAQAYSTYAAVTFSADGTITSCVIDASQSNVKFDAAGKITTDLAAALKTKVELGAAYGMKSKSGIGKEWDEQADSFSKYVTGKKIADVKGIAINEETVPTGDDLKASVTITIGDFLDIIEKASANAK